MGEYRYLADGNSKLLMTYILDDMRWPHSAQTYQYMFRKGVIVRVNPKIQPWAEAQPISTTIIPAAKEGSAATGFGAFTRENWKYPAKNSDLSSTRQQGQQRPTSAMSLGPNLGARMATRPRTEHRVSSLPGSRPSSTHSGQVSGKNNFAGVGAAHTVGVHTPPQNVIQPETSEGVVQQDSALSALRDDVPGPTATEGLPSATNENDPFASIWGKFRTEILPRISHTSEKDSRSFRSTMNQKAGNIFPEFDPKMMPYIKDTLKYLMASLRMWPGAVDLRIDLGRFTFLQVKTSRIQQKGKDDDEKYYNLNAMQQYLSKKHTSNEHIIFTQVLTTLGADANYMAKMKDDRGNPMWMRSVNGRSSTYEFTCRLNPRGSDHFDFVVEVDAVNFTMTVKPYEKDQNCIAVHCTERVWDFQLVLSSSQEVNEICMQFAKDLARLLKVKYVTAWGVHPLSLAI